MFRGLFLSQFSLNSRFSLGVPQLLGDVVGKNEYIMYSRNQKQYFNFGSLTMCRKINSSS